MTSAFTVFLEALWQKQVNKFEDTALFNKLQVFVECKVTEKQKQFCANNLSATAISQLLIAGSQLHSLLLLNMIKLCYFCALFSLLFSATCQLLQSQLLIEIIH